MQISLGPNYRQPNLTFEVPAKKMSKVKRRAVYGELHDVLAKDGLVNSRIDEHRLNHTLILSGLNLPASRRTPEYQSWRSSKLAQMVRFLSVLGDCPPSGDQYPLVNLTIEETKALDGSYPLWFEGSWPAINDARVAKLATAAMRSTAVQIGYVSKDEQTRSIDGIQAFVSKTTKGIGLQTSGQAQAHVLYDCEDHTQYGTKFRLVPRYLGSHAEQLVYLSGAMSIAAAETYVATNNRAGTLVSR